MLRNVNWENAEAIIPKRFPWLTSRYSAGPLDSQTPALLLSCGLEKWPLTSLNDSRAVMLWLSLSVNTCSIDINKYCLDCCLFHVLGQSSRALATRSSQVRYTCCASLEVSHLLPRLIVSAVSITGMPEHPSEP